MKITISYLKFQKLWKIYENTETDDECEEVEPGERLPEGTENGAGPLDRDHHHHVY